MDQIPFIVCFLNFMGKASPGMLCDGSKQADTEYPVFHLIVCSYIARSKSVSYQVSLHSGCSCVRRQYCLMARLGCGTEFLNLLT